MSTAPSQLPLALPVTASMAGEDFLVTPSNADAAQRINDPATPVLLLLGPRGSGKTHLARIWQARRGGQPVALTSLALEGLNIPALILENADTLDWTPALQEKAFHLLNIVRENRLQLLITASQPPREWPLTLADLRSRLLALPTVQIAPPDEALVAALLLKQFRDRQLDIPEDVLNYLIPRLPRDGAQIVDITARLDAAALAGQRAITIPLVRTVLDSSTEPSSYRQTP